MKILVTGRNGQLGWEMQRALLPLGEVFATGRNVLDMSRPETIAAVVDEVRPDVIVNASAYTAVDRAETEEELAMTVNGVAVGELAGAARRHQALLVHYSTDYVFNGQATSPYREDAPTDPQNAYGRSKLAGERAIADVGGDWLVFRTAWVYGVRGRNFMRTIADASLERESLRIVADQHGTPTAARTIADVSAHAIREALLQRRTNGMVSGIYHLTSQGQTTWHAFAEAIVGAVRTARGEAVRTRLIEPISAKEFAAPAPRPYYSVLDCARFDSMFGVCRPSWEAAFALVMTDYLP